MGVKRFVPPGVGPLFPGKRYNLKRGRPKLDDLKEAIQRFSVELGPNHPKVAMLKKDLALREGRDPPHPFPEKKTL